jgi:hypothetical protein
MSKKKFLIDRVKLIHWLNIRKLTLNSLAQNNRSLKNKINSKKKSFYLNLPDITFIENRLDISRELIFKEEKLPNYIFWSKEKIETTKRSINRDGIHFYNYYSLPTPKGFVGPVILDILCPKNKLPQLNKGHLEQAITVNLGPHDIFGRWGNSKNKLNFSKIRHNTSHINNWVVGDTYVEPTYCPHSYSKATNLSSQILSYTAKSPVEELIKKINRWPTHSAEYFINLFSKKNYLSTLFNFYLKNRCVDFNYISKKIKKKITNFNQLNPKNLLKICNYLDIDPVVFTKRKFKEDRVGKTYLSYKESFKSIRKYKSYFIASMASSVRYPDLFGIFIKVFKKKINLDLVDFASSHYLVTQGFLKCSIGKKKINLKQGDSIWMAPFVKHGFGGAGALIKISNGECISTGDIIESSKLYDIKKTLLRSYRDINTWGYN